MRQKGGANDVRIFEARWARDRAALMQVREAVFVCEQQVPWPLELDGLDDAAGTRHFLAVAKSGEAIGCARLLADGQIGRMAVMPAWRRQGIATALLDAVLESAHTAGRCTTFLHAQTDKIAFYARAGFVAEGEIFMDAGMPHILMVRHPA